MEAGGRPGRPPLVFSHGRGYPGHRLEPGTHTGGGPPKLDDLAYRSRPLISGEFLGPHSSAVPKKTLLEKLWQDSLSYHPERPRRV